MVEPDSKLYLVLVSPIVEAADGLFVPATLIWLPLPTLIWLAARVAAFAPLASTVTMPFLTSKVLIVKEPAAAEAPVLADTLNLVSLEPLISKVADRLCWLVLLTQEHHCLER